MKAARSGRAEGVRAPIPLCLGLLAALGLPAQAQAQTQVQLFGVVDLYAGHARSANSSWTRMKSGGNADSRIGFRGAEDLGQGMSARFVLESALNPETGSGGATGLSFARQARVGLAGRWGSLDLGRMYTPMFLAMSKVEPYVLNTVFSPMNLGAATFTVPAAATAQRAFTPRSNNMIRYRTPASPDAFAELAYAFGEVDAPNRSGELYGGAIGWTRAPFYVAYAFQQVRVTAAGATDSVTTRYQSLSTGYSVTPALQLFAIFTHTHASDPTLRDTRLMSAGFSWQLSPQGTLTASAARRQASGPGPSRLAWTVGYDHALSRRTALYARLLGVGDHGDAPAVANTRLPASRLLALGLRHTF